MELIYKTIVTGVGEKSMGFIDQGMFIMFKQDAPKDLKEFCIIHKDNNLILDIKEDDLLKLGDKEYKITGVGSVVNENLRTLGHITFRFNGEKECLPGSINVEKNDVPEIKVNEIIEIWR